MLNILDANLIRIIQIARTFTLLLCKLVITAVFFKVCLVIVTRPAGWARGGYI